MADFNCAACYLFSRCVMSGGMHGVAIADHGEKKTWPGYWDQRETKLGAQSADSS